MNVLLGSQSIGTAALSGAGRRLLALTSTFLVTITVPTGTASGPQVLCLQGLSHATCDFSCHAGAYGGAQQDATTQCLPYPARAMHRMCTGD